MYIVLTKCKYQKQKNLLSKISSLMKTELFLLTDWSGIICIVLHTFTRFNLFLFCFVLPTHLPTSVQDLSLKLIPDL